MKKYDLANKPGNNVLFQSFALEITWGKVVKTL